MATAKYDVLSQTVEVLLSPGSALFEVPVFQRTYAWGPEEISQLLDDIFGESAKLDLPYFLGSIVLASRDNGTSPEGDLVLDGQQRLTTLSLLICALILKMKESGDEGADENNMYLFSRRVKGKRQPKLTMQERDNSVFSALLKDPSTCKDAKYRTTKIGVALNRIIKGIEEYAESQPEYRGAEHPYDMMLQRLLYDVELVRITAPSEREAFRLFETLNDRGLSLSAADLIKNKLFSHCGNELDDAVEAWSNTLSCVPDDDIVNYLRSYWIAFKGFVRKRGLYDIYRNYIDTLEPTAATLFTMELEESAKAYEQIVSPNPNSCAWGTEVAECLDRLNLYRARSCRPVIVALSKLHEGDVGRGARICESITVRYSIVGEKNPNLLEKIYAEICRAIRESKDPWKSIAESKYMDDIPSDSEFIDKLKSMEISSITTAWREVLAKINRQMGTGETRIERGHRVHVEHIMPQSPRAVALQESGLSKEEAESLINRVGNLTLLSGRRNRQASNKPFSEKKSLYEGSEILMTRNLIEYERWGREEIDKRSIYLSELATKAYPHPREIAL